MCLPDVGSSVCLPDVGSAVCLPDVGSAVCLPDVGSAVSSGFYLLHSCPPYCSVSVMFH